MPRQPILSVLGHVDSGKCVAPDTEIQLADGSKVSAEKLFNDYRSEGERIKQEDGEVYSLEDGPNVFGIDDGKIEKCEVENIWKLEKDSLLEFKLRDGSEIKVTPEHPFLVVNNAELQFKEADKLKESEMAAVPSYLPVNKESLESLKARTLRTLSEDERILCFTKEEFSQELYENSEGIRDELLTNFPGDCKRNNRYRLQDIVRIAEHSEVKLERVYENIEFLKQSTLKQRAGSTSKKITLPQNISQFEDLAYALGLMLGDGSRASKVLYNNSSLIREEFVNTIEHSIGVSTKVKTFEDQVDEVYIECGKTLTKFFEILFDFPEERKSQSIEISEYAKRLPKSILSGLISGYFDADGYVNKKGGVEVTSASKTMINSLKSVLKRFEISAYITQEKEYHTLHITGRNNLESFTQINFRHPEKRERFEKNLKKSKNDPITGQTPISGKTIRKARQEFGASHTELDIPYQKKYESYETVSIKFLKEFIQSCRDLESSPAFRKNKEEKKKILNELSETTERSRIYEKYEIKHRRLLNHILSLKSEGFIEKVDNGLEITSKGERILEKWENGTQETLERLEKISSSDLRFVEIEEIEKKQGGTVYDFSTELETFIADDIVVHNTTLLDNIRESKIVEGESGGITQMIGATEVPLSTVEDVCGPLLDQLETDLEIPGLLFIDTPGHAAFSSLRKRGGSISDIAILVVDIEEGVQPQTEEAIKILKESGTPFVIALNKIDKLSGWKEAGNMFTQAIQEQPKRVQQKIDEEIYELMGELDEYDMMTDRFDRVDDFQKKAALVPISAMTGVGIPELLMVVTGLSQNYLADELEIHEGIGKGTVLEVSQEKGLGTTIDVIHYDGVMKKTDKLVYGTADGAKVTEIRALLEPRPLQEIRVDKQYDEVDEVHPASGVKISGKDLEHVISGAPIRTASEENLEQAKKEVEEELELGQFETQNEGIVVKADSLGSLEAVMREVEDLDINVQKAEVGPIKKSNIAEVQNESPEERAIMAFNTGMTEQGEKVAKDRDIKIFQSDVVYEIIEDYQDWKEELQRKKRQKALTAVSRPAKIEVLHDHVFRSSNPAVVGVKILDGVLNGGGVMNEEGISIGNVKSIQEQNEKVEKAEKGSQVAVSISNATVGRDFEEGDILWVNITGKEYKQLKELSDLLSAGEKDVLDEIVDIKDSKDPHWKL